ncbi:MAG: M23 family metallopeptidase [Clostridiales bacterium]|nr:M23 family metallopeptidase [Clostridiales bacterium]
MDKKLLNRIFLLTAAGVLFALGAVGVLRALRPEVQTGPVLMEAVQPETVNMETAEMTPAPTAAPISYENTVTLLVDRVPVMTLGSELAAKQMLWEYLSSSAVAPEGEKFLSARFDCELILTQGDPYVKPLEAGEALQLLAEHPALVPVRVTTLRTETGETSPEVTETTEEALPKGARIITQLGAGAVSETSVQAVYRAGELLETGTPVTRTLREARATILRNGTYTKKDTSGTPDRLEGTEGKSKGDLKLGYPMRGQIVHYFGYVDGKMNYGLEISNSAGTNIVAPGEGVVVYCGERGAYGFVVDIDHGNGFVSRLTHLSDVQVELNQRVFIGDKVGVLAADEDGGKPVFHYELIVDGIPYNPLFYID